MHRMRLWALGGLTLVFPVLSASTAMADATVFIGANTTPANRFLKGVSFGAGLLAVSFEFEYSATVDEESAAAPALKVGSGNALIQAPFMIHGFQPYVTAGVGVYRERLGAHSDTGFARNTGAGVKVALAGPVRLRVDYRVLKLGSGALYSPAHRIYAGLNLKF